jgi:RNA polymerase sigma-70 factor (ECF subfamily)
LNTIENDNNALIEQVKKGQKQVFSQLVKKYYGTVIYYLLGFGMSRSDAEDISQEAFINAYTKIDQYKSSGSFAGWLLRIARNLHIDKMRKEKKTETPVDAYTMNEFSDERTPEIHVISENSVNDVFSGLKPRERVIIDLRVFQLLPFAEIAEIMGSSEGNVRLIFHRVITRLRKQHQEKAGCL